MAQVPARLVYTDSDNNEQVIGSFQPQDITSGNISTFTVDEEAANYTNVVIEGGPSLQENMPTTLSEFGTSEPEIRVEKDENRDGTWETRARVYPEKSGSTDDRGRYKNKDLWGFKKYYQADTQQFIPVMRHRQAFPTTRLTVPDSKHSRKYRKTTIILYCLLRLRTVTMILLSVFSLQVTAAWKGL